MFMEATITKHSESAGRQQRTRDLVWKNSFSRKRWALKTVRGPNSASTWKNLFRNKHFKSDLKISNPKTKLVLYKGYKICSKQINNHIKTYRL